MNSVKNRIRREHINPTDGINLYYIMEFRNIVLLESIIQIFRRMFCSHDDSFSFRVYNDFDFCEYNKCTKCGKTLGYFKGFDEDLRGWFELVLRINLQILIISWWLGAATALLSFLLPIYTHHIIVGGIGWSIICLSTILIIYEIKKIKKEDKRTKEL
jgi:hypothetical protein